MELDRESNARRRKSRSQLPTAAFIPPPPSFLRVEQRVCIASMNLDVNNVAFFGQLLLKSIEVDEFVVSTSSHHGIVLSILFQFVISFGIFSFDKDFQGLVHESLASFRGYFGDHCVESV